MSRSPLTSPPRSPLTFGDLRSALSRSEESCLPLIQEYFHVRRPHAEVAYVIQEWLRRAEARSAPWELVLDPTLRTAAVVNSGFMAAHRWDLCWAPVALSGVIGLAPPLTAPPTIWTPDGCEELVQDPFSEDPEPALDSPDTGPDAGTGPAWMIPVEACDLPRAEFRAWLRWLRSELLLQEDQRIFGWAPAGTAQEAKLDRRLRDLEEELARLPRASSQDPSNLSVVLGHGLEAAWQDLRPDVGQGRSWAWEWGRYWRRVSVMLPRTPDPASWLILLTVVHPTSPEPAPPSSELPGNMPHLNWRQAGRDDAAILRVASYRRFLAEVLAETVSPEVFLESALQGWGW